MNCGKCHTCGSNLYRCLDGEEWCQNCERYRYYPSHGWRRAYSSDREWPNTPELDAEKLCRRCYGWHSPLQPCAEPEERP